MDNVRITFVALFIILLLSSTPMIGLTGAAQIIVAREIPEIGPEGGSFEVQVGPTPRWGSYVLGLIYLNIPEDLLRKLEVRIKAEPVDLDMGEKRVIWLEVWSGRILPSEEKWWEGRTKLAQSASSYYGKPILYYYPISYEESTIAIVWIRGDGDPDLIRIRVDVSIRELRVEDSLPTLKDVALNNSETPSLFALRRVAKSLGGNPLKIFEYVRNNVFTEPYWGFLRGASRTYYDLYGNDADQASLLITLLRESGVPARYAYGLVRVPTKYLADVLGLRNIDAAVYIYSTAGLLYQVEGSYAWIFHVWVRAYLNGSWIDLDPSVKKVLRKVSTPIRGVTEPPTTTSSELFANATIEYLKPLESLPVGDLVTGAWIVEEKGFTGPPGEYILIDVFSVPPERFRGKVTVYYPRWSERRGYDFRNGNYSFTLFTSTLGAYRLTARFIPADDEAARRVASRPGGLKGMSVDDPRARVRAQFLLNGLVISEGDAGKPGWGLPIKMRFRIDLPSGFRFVGWGDEILLGYAAYVIDFMKTRFYGEVGVEGAKASIISKINPRFVEGLDIDEVVGRILYMQARRYQIERWHRIETIWNYRLIVHIFPVNIHKAELYQILNRGGKVAIGAPYFGAGIGWNSWAAYWVVDPDEGVLTLPGNKLIRYEELDERVVPAFIPGSFYEGEVISKAHGLVPYSTVHAFIYAASKGIPIIRATRENLSNLPPTIPDWIKDGLAKIAEEWKGVEFNAFMPARPVPVDVLSIFVDDKEDSRPPEIEVAGKIFGVFTVIPLSRYHAAVGGLIYNIGRGVEYGGGAVSKSEESQYLIDNQIEMLGDTYTEINARNLESASKDPDEKLNENVEKNGVKYEGYEEDNERIAQLNEELRRIREQLESLDPSDPDYRKKYDELYNKYLQVLDQIGEELEKIQEELRKLNFQQKLLNQLYSGEVPIFFNPDGTPMEVPDLIRYLSDMGVDRETRLKVALHQREIIQRLNNIGYIEIPTEVNGKTVLIRLHYGYMLEVQSVSGYKYYSGTWEINEKGLAMEYANWLKSDIEKMGDQVTVKLSYALTKVEVVPADPIKVKYTTAKEWSLTGLAEEEIVIESIVVKRSELGQADFLEKALQSYQTVATLDGRNILDWKAEKLPGGVEAKFVYGLMNITREQAQEIERQLEQGKLPKDPPYTEIWLEGPNGEFAGYNPDVGLGLGLNYLSYSGPGSKPKHLAVYAVWPGIYYLNVMGTKKNGSEAIVTIRYNLGGAIQEKKLRFNVAYGELVKVPITVDKNYRLSIGEVMPGLRLSLPTLIKGTAGSKITVGGRVLDQFAANGVEDARISVFIYRPDGEVLELPNITSTQPDGSFSFEFTAEAAGIHHVTVLAVADGYHRVIGDIPVVVYGVLRLENDLVIPGELVSASLRVKDGSGNMELSLSKDVTLPAGDYIINLNIGDVRGWRVSAKAPLEIPISLEGRSVIRLSEILEAEALIEVESDVGVVEGEGWYKLGSTATLRAIPPEDGSYEFAGWEGDIESSQNPLSIRVSGPLKLKALWRRVSAEETTTSVAETEATQTETTQVATARETTRTTTEATRATTTQTITTPRTEAAPGPPILPLAIGAAIALATLSLIIIAKKRKRQTAQQT